MTTIFTYDCGKYKLCHLGYTLCSPQSFRYALFSPFILCRCIIYLNTHKAISVRPLLFPDFSLCLFNGLLHLWARETMSSPREQLSDASASQSLASTNPENQQAGSLLNGSSRLGCPFTIPLPTTMSPMLIKKKHSLLHNLYRDEGHEGFCQGDEVIFFLTRLEPV